MVMSPTQKLARDSFEFFDLDCKTFFYVAEAKALIKSAVNALLNCTIIVMSPPDRVGRHIVFPRASVCPSVCLSVRPSVRHKSCPLYNLKNV